LFVSSRSCKGDWHNASNCRYIAVRPANGEPAFSHHGQLTDIGPARCATLDHRARLFAPKTPAKMGGACPFPPSEVPIGEIPQPDFQLARGGTCRCDRCRIRAGQPGRRWGG
jgi:hypothetical protein